MERKNCSISQERDNVKQFSNPLKEKEKKRQDTEPETGKTKIEVYVEYGNFDDQW